MNARQFLLKAENKVFHANDRRYRAWFLRNRVTEESLKLQRAARFDREPLISILVPVYKTPLPFLREMIESVLAQSYGRFELILANASPEEKELSAVLSEYAGKDGRIKTFDLAENGGISRNTNEALRHAEGEFTALFDHDDLLEPDALYEYVKALNEDSGAQVFYCDEDKVTEAGNDWFFANFKPDFAPDMLRSTNYICHFLMVRTEIFREAGGLDPAFDGAQDYDLVLRLSEKTKTFVHVPRILYHWRSHSQSTAKSMDTKNYAASAGARALSAHLGRLGIQAEVKGADNPGWFHIDANEPEGTILEIETDIVTEKESLEEAFKQAYLPVCENHEAAFILIRRKGTEPLSEAQKRMLKSRFALPETGAAGPRLLYENGLTESAGIHVRKDGKALHYFRGEEPEKPGFMCRAITASNVQALSIDCLMIRAEYLRNWLRGGSWSWTMDGLQKNDTTDRLSVALGLFLEKTCKARLVLEPRVMVRTDRKEPILGLSDGVLKKAAPDIPEDPYYNPNFSETRPFLV